MSVLVGIPVAIATAEAAAAPVLAALAAIPIVGPVLSATAHQAIVAPLITLQVELASLLAMSPDGNFGQQLANVLNQLVQIPAIGPFGGGKAVIPALVDSLASSLRPLSESGETKESYRSYTGQRTRPAEPREANNCERQMDVLEIAFDIRPGEPYLFDFVADVFAESDRLYAQNTPAAFGMSLRFTGKTKALLGMQQWDRTCIVEVFVLRGVAASARFITTVYQLAERHRGILHWGLMNELTAAQVRNHYPRLSEWRQALHRIIEEGHGRSQTFQSTFSVTRGLEPEQYMPPTVVVPLEETGETYPYDFGVLELHERRSVTFHFRASGQHQLRVFGHDAEGDFKLNDVPASALLGTFAVPHNLELETVKATAMPGDEIQVKATFLAQRAGAYHGKLRIYTNAANVGAIVIPVSARVESFSLVLVQPSLPATLDLGGVDIGATKTATLTVRNDGTRGAWLMNASFRHHRRRAG